MVDKNELIAFITENYFKTQGWMRVPSYAFYAGIKINDSGWDNFWVPSELEVRSPDPKYYKELPDITQSFSDFKKFVLEPMEGEDFYFEADLLHDSVQWRIEPFDGPKYMEVIENNEILEAGVIAATRYWKEKNDE